MDIRASDEDRQRTVAALEHHAGAGRLTLDEFAERAQVAHGARTLDELAAIVGDLPADTTGGTATAEPSRVLLLLFAVAAAALILLGTFVAVLRA